MPGERKHVPRWAFEAVIVLIVAIVAVYALRGDGKDGYWIEHPMLAALLSGLLVLAIAGTAVERLLRIREERNWRGVARLACNTIGDDVTRRISATLHVLWRETGYEPPDLDGPRGDRPTDALLPEWEVREIPDGRERVTALDEDAPGEAGPCGTLPRGRIEPLMADETWRRWATRHLRELHEQARPALGQWAPVMLRSQGPRELLDRAALVVDHLGYLRAQVKECDPDRLEERWIALDIQARLLSNALWEEADEPDWCFALPDDVEDDEDAERYRLWDEPARPLESLTG